MWWWTEVARAGACCGGGPSALPTRASEYEHLVAGIGTTASLGWARWDEAGAVAGPSPAEQALEATVAASARWSRWGQLGVAVPARATHRGAAGLDDAGAGLGDLRTAVVLDPFPERSRPVPVLTLGLRLPTGRDWTEAAGPLLADVTGLPGVGGSALLTVERAATDGPWWVGIEVAGDAGTPPRTALSGAWGRYDGVRATILATARHERQLVAAGTARTALGARLVLGRPERWRGWVGLSSDVPVPLLGASLPVTTTLELGGALVR